MIDIKRKILKNPVSGNVISDEIQIRNEEGIIWIKTNELEELYEALGEKIAEMEFEAGATPKKELVTEPH